MREPSAHGSIERVSIAGTRSAIIVFEDAAGVYANLCRDAHRWERTPLVWSEEYSAWTVEQ
jgi:hypothetical protein